MLTAALTGRWGGPVGAAVLGTYAAVGLQLWQRACAQRLSRRNRAAVAAAIGELAAELRAGGTIAAGTGLLNPENLAGTTVSSAAWRGMGDPDSTVVGFPPGDRDQVVNDTLTRLGAAVRISNQLGAPLADLLDKIESDCRSNIRLRSAITAQTAGGQATALLLAALPLGGIAIGIGIGVDPMDQLLHTPAGAGCALIALGLQIAGLYWTSWLFRRATEVG